MLSGSGGCKFFSLYNKDAAVVRSIDFAAGKLTSVKSDAYVLFASSGIAQHLTRIEAVNLLSKSQRVSAQSLAGKVPEKQLWGESGKLVAVKVNGRW